MFSFSLWPQNLANFQLYFSTLGDNKVTLSVLIVIHREKPFFRRRKTVSPYGAPTQARATRFQRERLFRQWIFSIANFPIERRKNWKNFATKFINENFNLLSTFHNFTINVSTQNSISAATLDAFNYSFLTKLVLI